MTFQHADAIVKRLGPCRIAVDMAGNIGLARELALLGCDVVDMPMASKEVGPIGAGTAGFLDWNEIESASARSQVVSLPAGMDTLVVASGGGRRALVESVLFDGGWMRHPGGLMSHDYPAWTGVDLPALSFYRRTPPEGWRGPLRQRGQAADAAIARYAVAADHVRPGDTVLVDGADALDGVAILAALSRASSIIRAADTSEAATGDGPLADIDLSNVADHSVDMIAAVAPAVPRGWVARLDEYSRVLKFDGRLVLAIRRDKSNVGSAPTGWTAMMAELNERFLIEKRLAQGAGSTAGEQGPQVIVSVNLEQRLSTEWLYVVASANPLAGEGAGDAYRHPAFADAGTTALTDFAAAYDNPHLYRAMVQMGERVSHEMTLARLAEYVIEHARADSADRGAAMTVLGYRLLEMRAAAGVADMLDRIRAYTHATAEANDRAHIARWRLSLAFLAGRLNEMVGDRTGAIAWFRAASDGNWQAFSPILATKAVAGAFYEARLHLAGGDTLAARQCFRRGVDIALEATAARHGTLFGDPERPLPFYLTELAEVVDMASQCAAALANIELHDRDPGLFWRQVDVRRFGLASWNRDLECTNERLQKAVGRKAA